MKFSWEKLKRLAQSQHKSHKKVDERVLLHHRPCPKLLDDFTHASKELHQMRKCKNMILYATTAAANSAFEFSESLREIGTCLLEQSALTDDEQSGNVLRMLSKVQFELQELVDSYRSHIFQTTTTLSDQSVLNQLQTVEDMKQQCDGKRNVYQGLLTAQMKIQKSRSFKGETNSPQQLQAASDEYEREAICFVFRLNSLKDGQTRSLLTQAVQHHAAQISLFSKGLKSLEAIDLEVRSVAEHRYKERCSSLKGAHNLRYTSPLELKKHEINFRADKTKENNPDRASNKLHPPSSSTKLGMLHDLPSPRNASNGHLVRSTNKVRKHKDLYVTIENRLTPSNAAAYPLPIPPKTESPRGHYTPLSDDRFCHSAPKKRSSDLYNKSENSASPSNAASYPNPMYPKNEWQNSHYVPVLVDEGVYHSAPLGISQDLYATNEIPWTPSNVTAYRLPLETELPRGYYIPLTHERAKAILGSFRRGQILGDLQ